MQGTQTTDVTPKKRRRVKKYACSKCAVDFAADNLPSGWLVVWDDKLGRYVHYCVGCQHGKRSRKKQ